MLLVEQKIQKPTIRTKKYAIGINTKNQGCSEFFF